MKKLKNQKLHLSWIERTVENTERIGAMYCFKRCDYDQL